VMQHASSGFAGDVRGWLRPAVVVLLLLGLRP
jgi:hypothetical protein